MSEQKGIKETKEALEGMITIVCAGLRQLKNGFQIADLIEAFKEIEADPVKKAQVDEALKGVQECPSEISDLSWMEGAELGMAAVKRVPDMIDALKK